MTKIIMYLLESSAVLAFFYLLYVLILRRETFFSLNRFFLLGILVFSLLFPFMSFDFSPEKVPLLERPVQEISKFRTSYYDAMAKWEFENFNNTSTNNSIINDDNLHNERFGWADIMVKAFLVLYAIGVVVCLSRIIMALQWLWKLTTIYPKERVDGVYIVRLPNPVAPFSFLNYVFVHEALVDSPEFDQILAHEKAHIQQRHSIDLIFVQLLAAFLWINPLIWKLIKSLKATHEYIADEKIMNSGYSLVEYQTMLLSQLISNNSYGLVHNFNLSFIKKRIAMMKNNKSGWSGKVKVAVALLIAAVSSAIFVQCNSGIDEQVSEPASESVATDFTEGVDLPVLPETKYRFTGDMNDVANLTIVGDEIMINGKDYELEDVASVIMDAELSERGVIILRIDKNQKMKLVRDVMWELRQADKRKMLYLGKGSEGEKVEVALLLPPTNENMANKYNGAPLPDVEEVIASGNLDPLRIDLGRTANEETRQEVYDFVMEHVKKGSSDYLIIGDYADDDVFNNYLSNVLHIQEGFKKIYQERAQELYGKDYYELEKEEFKAVRENIPTAVSISDKKG